MEKPKRITRPSNLPGKEMLHNVFNSPGPLIVRCGRKVKLGPCAKGRPQKESPAWVADWLKRQVGIFMKENNIPQEWEPLILSLCRIIYLAKRHHNDKRGYQPNDNYARRDEEGDGLYLDRLISPELRGFAK